MKSELHNCPMCGLQPKLIRTNGFFLYDCETNFNFASDIYKLFEDDDTKEWLFRVSNDKFSAIQLDELAELWGDDGKFRRCRDRLRKLVNKV